jgi:hypothetical protein
MEFFMHKCGLHYYDPRNKKHVAFFNTVSVNKEGFMKRHIKGAKLARTLQDFELPVHEGFHVGD